MRRAVTAVLGAAAIALPPMNAIAAMKRSAEVTVAPKKTVVVRTVSGGAVPADRWGEVTITLKVRKTIAVVKGVKRVTRRWFDIGGSFTYHTDRSLFIMQNALPALRQAALQSHSANVDIISGATYTSDAFLQSMQQALVKANKV